MAASRTRRSMPRDAARDPILDDYKDAIVPKGERRDPDIAACSGTLPAVWIVGHRRHRYLGGLSVPRTDQAADRPLP